MSCSGNIIAGTQLQTSTCETRNGENQVVIRIFEDILEFCELLVILEFCEFLRIIGNLGHIHTIHLTHWYTMLMAFTKESQGVLFIMGAGCY